MLSKFTEHPKSVGENYFTHFKSAIAISLRLFFASFGQIIHAVFPMIHPPLGSDAESLVELLNSRIPKKEYDFEDDFVRRHHSGR